MCDPTTQITIDKLKGSPHKKDLLGCYFQYVSELEDTLSFFAPDGHEKATNLKKGSEFTFKHKHKGWTLTIETTSCELVTGRWKDDDTSEPDQSYQAQAGVTVPDDKNAVAAKVY